MAEIILSYDADSVPSFVNTLKTDVEKLCDVSVSLDDTNEWETSRGFTKLDQEAKELVVLENTDAAVTAWIMFDRKGNKKRRAEQWRKPTLPPSIDFSQSYEDGLEIFKLVLEGKIM